MTTHTEGQSKAMNDSCLFHTVRGYIVKQYESQKCQQPAQRRQALHDNDTVIIIPPSKDFSPTDSIESYIALRFFPVALASASFYQGRCTSERLISLWQPVKKLALRINVSIESRMRCHHGKPSLGDQFDIPDHPNHPNYLLREAISALKRCLEQEIHKVLSEEGEKHVHKKSAVLHSAVERKPVDRGGKPIDMERQNTGEQQWLEKLDVAKVAPSKARTSDGGFPARERLNDNEWEFVDVEEDDESLSMENMELEDE